MLLYPLKQVRVCMYTVQCVYVHCTVCGFYTSEHRLFNRGQPNFANHNFAISSIDIGKDWGKLKGEMLKTYFIIFKKNILCLKQL